MSNNNSSNSFKTPIATFEDTLDWQKITTLTNFQILSQAKLVEAKGVESVERIII
jgi:hypothetical protein